MGYLAHRTIVCTTWCKESIKKAHDKSISVFIDPDNPNRKLVSEILDTGMNSTCSFFIAPDGSKEGWAMSDLYDEKRASFIEWIHSNDPNFHLDYVEVRFGGDQPDKSKIESTNYN